MSKFCEKCGAQMEDNMSFCMSCGAKVEGAVPTAEADTNGAAAKKLPEGAVKLGIAAIAVILVIVIISSLFGSSYKDPIKSYEKIMNGKISKSSVEKLAPDEYWEYCADEADEKVKDYIKDYVDDLKDSYEDSIEEMEDEYGKNVKYSFKIEDKKELSDKKVEKIAEALNDRYDIKEKSVKKAYKLDVEVTVKGKEDDDDYDTEMVSVKIGGNWYLISYYEYDGEVSVSFRV